MSRRMMVELPSGNWVVPGEVDAVTREGGVYAIVNGHPVLADTNGRALRQVADLLRRKPKRAAPADTGEDTFEEWWSQYPGKAAQKGSKKKAREKWARLTAEERKAAMAALPNYAEHVRLSEWRPAHAVTWLNQERWEVHQEKPDPRDYTHSRKRQADHNAGFTGEVVL